MDAMDYRMVEMELMAVEGEMETVWFGIYREAEAKLDEAKWGLQMALDTKNSPVVGETAEDAEWVALLRENRIFKLREDINLWSKRLGEITVQVNTLAERVATLKAQLKLMDAIMA